MRFLFNKNTDIRNEAVSRLYWLLTTEKNSNKKIPKIKTLEDRSLSNIFQFDYMIDITKTKTASQFYQV